MGIHDGHRHHLRERYLKYGLDSFPDHEVLELLLFYAIPRKNTNLIAHELLNHYGSLTGVLSAPADELRTFDGIGESAAVFLTIFSQLNRRIRLENMPDILNTTELLGGYLTVLFYGETEEMLYELCLDAKCRLISCRKISDGGVASVFMNIRILIEHAVLDHAVSVVIAHNHPDGDTMPSKEDCVATSRIKDALALVGVVLQDHIIVSGNEYASMRNTGFL